MGKRIRLKTCHTVPQRRIRGGEGRTCGFGFAPLLTIISTISAYEGEAVLMAGDSKQHVPLHRAAPKKRRLSSGLQLTWPFSAAM
jgi:hypothetical protein